MNLCSLVGALMLTQSNSSVHITAQAEATGADSSWLATNATRSTCNKPGEQRAQALVHLRLGRNSCVEIPGDARSVGQPWLHTAAQADATGADSSWLATNAAGSTCGKGKQRRAEEPKQLGLCIRNVSA
jgi:hypothetical protein